VAVPGAGADPAAPFIPRAPFTLSPEQAFQLDQVLAAWERRNQEVKSVECEFWLFEYDYIFTQRPGQPRKLRDHGILKYAAPDKGLYKIEGQRSEEWIETAPGAGAWRKSAEARDEQWICDGKSIFQYNCKEKRRIEHPLPPELQGKAISDGPLPFVFGTEAQKLKERYWLRINTPPDVRGEIWLEAYPRYQKDAANFYKLDVILKTNGLLPDAIQVSEPNRKDRKVYKFEDVVVNRRLRFLEPDWFRAPLPLGWRAEVDPPQGPAQAGYPRQAGGTLPRR
jgi:TIGR03009 family protein